jgi:membrane fusion protein (multidrug efflux system)
LESSPLEQIAYATGTLLANEELDLRSEIAGRITKINFREGSPVHQGQLLVKLNDADLKATLKRLELQQALAKREEERAKSLLDQKLISLEEYDAKRNAFELTAADIEKTRSDIAKTELYAPFSGVVGLRAVSSGSTITPTTSIARIEQIDPIKIEFSVPEKYARTLQPGSGCRFSVTGSEREYDGTVYAIEPRIDPATRTLKVRATAPNRDGALTPGAFAKVEISLAKIAEALTVPSAAIVPMIDGQSVYILQNGKAVSKTVTTGIRTDSTVQVLSGISAGDTIVTTGVMQLRPGMAIKAANDNSSERAR